MNKNLLLLACILVSGSLFASTAPKPVKVKVISEEVSTINGQLNIQLRYCFRDSVVLGGIPSFELPHGWSLTQPPTVNYNTFLPN